MFSPVCLSLSLSIYLSISACAQYFQALDAVMEQLQKDGVTARLRGVSVSGQQHGSVYWSTEAARVLAELDPAVPLKEQLPAAFSLPFSPIWMDSRCVKGGTVQRSAVQCGGVTLLLFLNAQHC